MEKFAYLKDRYMIIGEGQEWIVLIPVIAAVFFVIAIYFFTKNKWGSILISPIVTVLLSAYAFRYVIHLYFILSSFIISYIVIKILDSKKESKST
ncbi:hypothetical protein AB1282_20075 [Gottfriedia sp. S16(2024)]|uniref:hypothetical protein n=1 Tax=Gottfriedia sp. S16(2024) TaxID=3162883 RepID=UPI003D25AC7D